MSQVHQSVQSSTIPNMVSEIEVSSSNLGEHESTFNTCLRSRELHVRSVKV
jgi:hypothetical protein